jgi:hypothetical protein
MALGNCFPGSPSEADNGWAYVGKISAKDDQVWSLGPFLKIDKMSGSPDRKHPVREGDVITLTQAIPQVVIDYKYKKMQDVAVRPTARRDVVRPEDDYTGGKFEPTGKYTIQQLVVKSIIPTEDRVVWARLTPAK